jgi:dTDP-4-dehydrorhamnose 3,5-epimerase
MEFEAYAPAADPDIRLINFSQHKDERGVFSESFRAKALRNFNLPSEFPQDCFSRSPEGTLRGMHFQRDPLMGKLIRVNRGRALLVARNVFPGSKHFGSAFSVELEERDRTWVWAPGWFARGYLALAPDTEVHYKCTAEYCADSEATVLWNDPSMFLMGQEITFTWPMSDPSLSVRDRGALTLSEALDAGLLDFSPVSS